MVAENCMNRLPDFEAWAVFAKVAELGSFSAAAEEIGLSKPTVSKLISRLEGGLGFALLHRTSRRLSLTEAGRGSLERARRLLEEGQALEEEALAQSATPRGRIRLAAPLSFGLAYLGSILPAFRVEYPEITLDLAFSDRQVDLIGESFDLALRIGQLEDSSLTSRRLCSIRILLVGAPGYLGRQGRPTHPEQLAGFEAMVYSGGSRRGSWRFTHPIFGETTIEPHAKIWSDNADTLNPMLIAGQGLALQPEFLVWREIRQGALEVVLPDWSPPVLGLYLLSPPQARPLRVQKLVDYLSRALAKPPWLATA